MDGRKKRAFLGGKKLSEKKEFERGEPSREEIEAGLDATVSNLVASVGHGKKVVPGWKLWSIYGVDSVAVNETKFPFLNESKAAELISLSEENCHAFDVVQYIASMQIIALKATGVDMCPNITLFGAEVLNGERVRPPQKGRPLSEDIYLKLWQYVLSKFVVATTKIRLTRNDASDERDNFSACDAIAEAFCRAGHHSTYSQIKSINFDSAHKDVRNLAEYLGLCEGL